MRAARPLIPLAILVAVLVAPTLALAQSTFRATPPQARPEAAGNAPVLQAVIDCRALTDSTARLACYDAAAARLQQAESAGEVVVVDRAQVREARRQIFGFSVPALDLFGGRSTARPQDRVDRLEGVVRSSSFGLDGKRVFRLEDGAVWRQFGSEELRVRAGSRVVITRGLIGSFFMRVDNQPGVRVQRVQ